MSGHGTLSAAELERVVLPAARAQPYPLLFVTISGAHLYGFPSPDSDFDLRGIHVLPLRDVLGLDDALETVELAEMREGRELDVVTHDLRKFVRLLLKPNGYVLEQLYSPLVVLTSPEHDELKTLTHACITRSHSRHYLGFAESQWRLFHKEQPPRVKPLLYVFRVLLSGIHLLRTGEVEANLLKLNDEFRLGYLDELIARKLAATEQSILGAADLTFFEAEYGRLRDELEQAATASTLPEHPTGYEALNDFLVRTRLDFASRR